MGFGDDPSGLPAPGALDWLSPGASGSASSKALSSAVIGDGGELALLIRDGVYLASPTLVGRFPGKALIAQSPWVDLVFWQ